MRVCKRLLLFLLPLLGLLLTGCEPSGQVFNIVERLTLIDGRLYARVSEDCSFGKGCYLYLTTPDRVYVSADLGSTWTEDARPPAQALEQLSGSPTFPRTACLPSNPQVCYLLTGQNQVLESNDGSQSWQVTWRMPLERLKYMERTTPLMTVPPSITPTDLVIFDTGGSTMIFAALGNQGLLIRKPTGEWVRAPLAGAKPLPTQAAAPLDAIRAVAMELIFVFALVFCATPFFAILHILFPRLNAAWWTPILLVLVGWACFLLWSYGVIPFYEIALAAAITLDAVILIWQIARHWALAKPAPNSAAAPSPAN